MPAEKTQEKKPKEEQRKRCANETIVVFVQASSLRTKRKALDNTHRIRRHHDNGSIADMRMHLTQLFHIKMHNACFAFTGRESARSSADSGRVYVVTAQSGHCVKRIEEITWDKYRVTKRLLMSVAGMPWKTDHSRRTARQYVKLAYTGSAAITVKANACGKPDVQRLCSGDQFAYV